MQGPKPVTHGEIPMSSGDCLVTVLLPSYNEAAALPAVIAGISRAVRGSGVRLELIVIDDGSTDATRDEIVLLSKDRDDLRYIGLSRNFGKEAAITAGLYSATGDAVILMDADGQHPPDLLPHFIQRWQAGMEVVAGVQKSRKEPPLNRWLKHGYYWLMDAGSPIRIPEDAGDFRLMDRKVVDAINALPERNRLMKGIYAWVGFKTEFVAFEALPRIAGETKYTLLRLFALAITGVTAFTTVPLRLVSIAGLFVSIFSIIFGCYLLFEHYVLGDHLPGWATISVGMMFLSGIQLLSLGIIAEYVGRTFEEVKQRPLFIISEDTASPLQGFEDAKRHAKTASSTYRRHQAEAGAACNAYYQMSDRIQDNAAAVQQAARDDRELAQETAK